MNLKSILLGAALGLSAMSAMADIIIEDPYARSSSPAARVGAAFMVIRNTGNEDDRLIAASSDAAKRIELHTHVITDGVAKMMEVEGGFVVPAHGEVLLQRGGYHVMMMGLTAPFVQGEALTLDLVFEKAGEMQLVVPIDSERQGNMNHENTEDGTAMEGMSDN